MELEPKDIAGNSNVAMIHAAAINCSLPQILYSETLQVNVTQQAYTWEGYFISVLHVLARYSCLDALKYFIEQRYYNPDMITKIHTYKIGYNPDGTPVSHIYTNDTNYTPLMYSIRFNATDSANYLIEKGANVNRTTEVERYTSLMLAAKYNAPTMIEPLLNSGVNCTALDIFHETAYDIAVLEQNLYTASLLEACSTA